MPVRQSYLPLKLNAGGVMPKIFASALIFLPLTIANFSKNPVLIKAAAGGGGKGMKLVKNEKELDAALIIAKQEAKKYFADDSVYIEKYFENPRHIEVQILSDKKTTIHLGERDCSVQRKHQKLIEESPSPVLEEKVRQDLLNKTVNMVSKLDYEGAGTVELIYDKG